MTKIKFNIKPTPGYVLVEPAEATKKTESGIYLPDTSDEKPQKGFVLAIGDEEITENGTKKKAPVKVGDEIIYKKWGGTEVKIEGKDYLFAKFEDVLAVISPK